MVGLEPAPREKCEEESEVAANAICTQEKVEGAECRVCILWIGIFGIVSKKCRFNSQYSNSDQVQHLK